MPVYKLDRTVFKGKGASAMYVVFEDGARQHRVSEGEFVKVDYRELDKGATLEFPRVLLVQSNSGVLVGRPCVPGAKIVGEVIEHTSEKYSIQKFRKRKNYRRKTGHRQPYTTVKISQIVLPE
jgi:large subunit ribosomal protein L21